MIKLRSFAQFTGGLVLAGAAAGLCYEGYLMVQTGSYRVVSLAELWTVAHRPSIDLLRTSLDNDSWNLLLKTYLGWPSWAGLTLPGVLLLILGAGDKGGDVILRKLPTR